ncbi:MAG: HAMP domain-containing histidine kinase, partial [Hymenobacter sp.]
AGVSIFGFDVTEQVEARQQVQSLNQELAAINEEMQATNEELHESNSRLLRTNTDLDTFVYTASHDLKSPITNVEGLLLALRDHLPANAFDNALVPRLLDMMAGAVGRFQQTLGHLTDISRLQQELDQPAEAVDLPALVEAVRLDILPELTAAGATLVVDLDGCPTVHFSAKNLRSIVYNLLSNAVKYRDPDRPAHVQLRCRLAAGRVLLEVEDNGLGLSNAQQNELFRMFRRLHSHVAGSGVGLYMVKKMVENAGGTLSVQSQPEVGSTFTVSLPIGR